MTLFTTAPQWSVCRARLVKSTLLRAIYITSILILSFPVNIVFMSDLFTSSISTELCQYLPILLPSKNKGHKTCIIARIIQDDKSRVDKVAFCTFSQEYYMHFSNSLFKIFLTNCLFSYRQNTPVAKLITLYKAWKTI
jgi:hypothetical protein